MDVFVYDCVIVGNEDGGYVVFIGLKWMVMCVLFVFDMMLSLLLGSVFVC